MSAPSRPAAFLGVGLVATVLLAGAVGPATVQPDGDPLTVTLRPDGSAALELTVSVELTDPDQRQAFEALADDEVAAADYLEEYVDELAPIVDATAERTGREMTIEDPSISFDSTGDVGTIAVTLTWTNLAAVEEERLVLTEPFASGFESDRPVVVVPPEGYAVESATPTPTESANAAPVWDAGRSLEGYRLVLAPDESGDPLTVEQPGFGHLVALVAVVGTTLLFRSR